MKFRWLLIAFAAIALTGCTTLFGTPVPTPYPTEYIPTVIALTVQAGYSPTPTGMVSPTPQVSPSPQASATPSSRPSHTPTRVESPEPSATQRLITTPPTATRRPSRTPTITLTPTLLPASIQIILPGPASRVVSPLTLQTYLQPGANGRVRIELLGENGNLLYGETTNNLGITEGRVYLSREIEFEIAGVSEIGRLQISTKDSYGRLIALNSVDLILLSVGEADVTSGGDLLDPIIIRQPVANTLIQGGTVTVSGMVRQSSDKPLLVELVDAKGAVVGYRQASVMPSADGSHTPFLVEVAYTVTGPTWVRLIVREESTGRIAGTIHLSSVEVLLGP